MVKLLLEARADAEASSTGGTAKDIVSQRQGMAEPLFQELVCDPFRAKEWRIGGGDGEEELKQAYASLLAQTLAGY